VILAGRWDRCQRAPRSIGHHLRMANRGRSRASASRTERRRAAIARRRRYAQLATQGERRQQRKRRLVQIGAVVVVVAMLAGLGTGLVLVLRGGGDSSSASSDITASLQSPVVADEGGVLAVDQPPASYELTYRIETAGSEAAETRTEVVTVRRPYDSHVVVRTGDAPSGDLEVDVRSNLGLYADTTDPSAPDIGSGIPAAALADVRVDGVLDDLVAAGLFVPRERREVAGRTCQVYRTGQVVEAQQLAAPTDTNYADACIDAAGLVLEEVAFVDGTAQLYEIAVAVDTTTPPPDDEFAITGEPRSFDDGGIEVTSIDPDTAPYAGYWTPTPQPAGATHTGRYLVRRPDAAQTTTTAGTSSPGVETYVDVYTNGASFVIVQQGAVADAPDRDTTLGKDVDGGALGQARVAYGLAGATLVAKGPSNFVEITAPMSADDLAALAQTFTSA
jgi:hypothetical protein